jgi:hypothetical protein
MISTHALDRAPLTPRRPRFGHLSLAIDRDSVRSYSIDGHLHIGDANISCAEVN